MKTPIAFFLNLPETDENIKPSDGEIFYPELYYRDQINLNNELSKPHNEFKHQNFTRRQQKKLTNNLSQVVKFCIF